ncbi:MAG TPA: GNAT family N-acetyltransferase [Terriglobales bacterium]|nr:GNAT family N-acetyltransferase [Terriglobales bacterium]
MGILQGTKRKPSCRRMMAVTMMAAKMTASIRATQPADLPALAEFLVRVYKFDPSDHRADPQLLEWKYLYPRDGWEGSRSYVLEKDGQIVAHCGICPVTFHLPDRTPINSETMTDWGADPSAPGVGVMLYRKLMAMAPTSFVIGGAPATRLMLPRIGFRHVGEALIYAAWLRPWREFRTRPRTGKSILRLLHGLTHPARNRRQTSAAWDFAPVNQFDDSLVPVLNDTKRTWTYCARTPAGLNYVLKCPHLKMQGFLLRRQGRLMGYFILGRAEWEARLLDLVVNSADANDWNSACAAVTKAAQLDPQVCRIRTLATFSILSQALAWNGYWCQYKEPIMIHDPANALAHAFPVSFQLIDGDSGY